jgi:hypothetical protein
VCAVLGDPAYRGRARILRSKIEATDGLNRAAELIGAAFGDPSPSAAAVAVPADRGRLPERMSAGRNAAGEG